MQKTHRWQVVGAIGAQLFLAACIILAGETVFQWTHRNAPAAALWMLCGVFCLALLTRLAVVFGARRAATVLLRDVNDALERTETGFTLTMEEGGR